MKNAKAPRKTFNAILLTKLLRRFISSTVRR
jgi:hypothetical protein